MWSANNHHWHHREDEPKANVPVQPNRTCSCTALGTLTARVRWDTKEFLSVSPILQTGFHLMHTRNISPHLITLQRSWNCICFYDKEHCKHSPKRGGVGSYDLILGVVTCGVEMYTVCHRKTHRDKFKVNTLTRCFKFNLIFVADQAQAEKTVFDSIVSLMQWEWAAAQE